MSRPTTRRAAAQSRADTDPDLPIPDSPGTDTSVNAVGGLTDTPDGADPVADTPNVSARELMELLGRVLADRAGGAAGARSARTLPNSSISSRAETFGVSATGSAPSGVSVRPPTALTEVSVPGESGMGRSGSVFALDCAAARRVVGRDIACRFL